MPSERAVHIVDDDAAFCRSLEQLLRSADFVPVLYETTSALLDAVSEISGGCLLLDVYMPGMDGLELQVRLAQSRIRLPVIVMTGRGDMPSAVRAMKAGAVDFIEKPFGDERLMAAIEAALAAGAHSAQNSDADQAARRIAALSRRERDVLDGLMAGDLNKAIAHHLGISVRTVEVHRARMLARLRVRSVAQAIRLGVMAALPPADENRRSTC
jgi:two-component system response regulator FixJ